VDLGLTGRAALVAGASSGLGLAIAAELAAEGCDVSIGARDPERLAEAAEKLAQLDGGRVHHATVDVRDEAERRAWVADAAETFGGLQIVVANAGGPPPGIATAHGLQAYRDAVELSLLSQIGLVQEALPHLEDAGWGRVLFVTSQSVRQPIPNLALSNTARAGVLGYAKSLVVALGAGGITVNVLAPGSHLTPRAEALARQRGDGDVTAGLEAMAADVSLGRVGDPHEFAAAAAFLASERASYITGAVLPVDGGATNLLL
jgi:3-oxoacyl-[acyl-carrier protein] reductase